MKNILILAAAMTLACGDKENEDTSSENEVADKTDEPADTGETSDTANESEEETEE